MTINLSVPRAGEPDLDLDTSYVALRDEGSITKSKRPDLGQEAQREAEDRLTAAANGEGELIELVEE